ncbi:hypothetical protein [Parasitella parasitica]|uniref:Uncharacterized protein n=1 Tax=Parasitella parasitica TaxID=35722 RepID=A0A0B7MPW7_9FUNG|nr:hypothetical protein [Parasitella parasitica]
MGSKLFCKLGCVIKLIEEKTSEAYFNRFSGACVEVGYDICDTPIADAFPNGFPDYWQIQITALLCTSFPDVTSWTIQQVTSCPINILSTIKCLLTIAGRASAAAAAARNGKSGPGSGAGGAGSSGGNKSFDPSAHIVVLSGLLDTNAPSTTYL